MHSLKLITEKYTRLVIKEGNNSFESRLARALEKPFSYKHDDTYSVKGQLFSGGKYWADEQDLFHRLNGPAYIDDGIPYYFIHGVECSKEEHAEYAAKWKAIHAANKKSGINTDF